MKRRIPVLFRKTKKWPNFNIRICVFSGTLSSFSHVSSRCIFSRCASWNARCIDIIHTAHLTSGRLFHFPKREKLVPDSFEVRSVASDFFRTNVLLFKGIIVKERRTMSPNWNQEKVRECDNWLARFIVGGHRVSVSGSTSAIKWSIARRRRNGDVEISEKRIKNGSLLLLA